MNIIYFISKIIAALLVGWASLLLVGTVFVYFVTKYGWFVEPHDCPVNTFSVDKK